MKILQINQNYNQGSTGRIMREINDTIVSCGHESFMLCAYTLESVPNLYVMETDLPRKWAGRKNELIQRLTGMSGYTAWGNTRKAVKWIEDLNPDIIHLHNIHGDWINIGILFSALKRINKPIVWTLHDCWVFTGRCSHFENIGCYRWQTGCFNCPDKKVYPRTYFFDFSKRMWINKKALFTSLNEIHIVTPSQWLANYVKESYMGKYDVSVINNGINLECFTKKYSWSKYIPSKDKKIILGVASSWTTNKGLHDFVELNKQLDSQKYQIVLVGLNSRQLTDLPKGIIGVAKTGSVDELAELYSNANVFVNPTYQDNYPTVNLEAIACGTPVITYRTGGSVESVPPEVGVVVDKGDVASLKREIEKVCEQNIFNEKVCIDYAKKHFGKFERYFEYISIYNRIYEEMIENYKDR